MKKNRTKHKKLKLATTVLMMLFSVCININMVSAKEVPEGYTLIYGSNDEYHNAEYEFNGMDEDADGKQSQITPMSEIPEGYTAIRTVDDLYGINNDLSGNYILMNDIDLSGTARGGNLDTGHGWTPIGAVSNENFEGVLDGNGHYIKNMHIYGQINDNTWPGVLDTDDIGLFSWVSGSVRNLGLIDCDIAVSKDGGLSVGGITGKLERGYGDMEISGCFVTGKISVSNSGYGYINVGSIAGESSGRIEDSFNCADLQADSGKIGGILGYLYGAGYVERCYNVGKILNTGETSAIGGIGINGPASNGCKNCFYLNSSLGGASGDDISTEGISLTEAQMQMARMFTGFDFDKVWYLDPAADYSYPQLKRCPLRRVSNLLVESAPEKSEYSVGEDLDLTGGKISVTYENGIKSSLALEQGMVSGYDKTNPGKQEIMISYAGGTASFPVTVKEVFADSLKLNYEEYSLNRGKTFTLIALFSPKNVTNKELTWETDNELVATVSNEGEVKGLNSGKTVITAKTDNGVEVSCTVTVNVPAKKIQLSASNLILKKGQKKKITAVMTPLDATDDITWISSNPKIVKVNRKGMITAKKQGTAVVMAKAGSGATKKIRITVRAN